MKGVTTNKKKRISQDFSDVSKSICENKYESLKDHNKTNFGDLDKNKRNSFLNLK